MDKMTTPMSLKTTEERKRLAKILAARLNVEDVQTLINFLLQREIDRYFPKDMQAALLSGPNPESDIGSAPFPNRGTAPTQQTDSDINHSSNHHSSRRTDLEEAA